MEYILGSVSIADQEAGFLSVRRTNPANGRWEEVRISVPRKAELKGISSLGELEFDAEVKIEACRNGVTGNYEASSIELLN